MAALSAAACSKKKPAPAAEADKGANAGAKPSIRQPGTRRGLAPIEPDEVRALLPLPSGARELTPLRKAQVGERVEVVVCMQGELAALGAALVAEYGKAGWSGVKYHDNPNAAGRANLSGHKPPYVLFGTLQRGDFDDCAQSGGFVRVTLGAHEIEQLQTGHIGSGLKNLRAQ
jgi:hypothetical protein